MPFKWKCKGRKQNCPEDIRNAVLEVVKEQKKIRTTAKKYDIDKMTLLRYIRKYKNDVNTDFFPNFVTSQMFTKKEENVLAEYLLTLCALNYESHATLASSLQDKAVLNVATLQNRMSSQILRNPEEIRPYPKAPPRINKGKKTQENLEY
ncbi:hypothetical protein ABEB36_014922 [Hypothenemus hampei]|uniref:HTH psq-type domain-containing protein n=1 Tax=Hypothenemus hampei TaxID=57062 RepID=A0ABD1E1A3_HYPHA